MIVDVIIILLAITLLIYGQYLLYNRCDMYECRIAINFKKGRYLASLDS